MNKKSIGSIIAIALVLALSLCLVGCTISGTYTAAIGDGELNFSGKNFTYKTGVMGAEVKGTFETVKVEDTEKKDGILGSISFKDKDGKEIMKGFYGKDNNGVEFVSYGPITMTKKK